MKRVLRFKSDSDAGKYFTQLENASLTASVDRWIVEGYDHLIIGEDLPDPDLAGLDNNNVYTFHDESDLIGTLNSATLPDEWEIRNKGAMFTWGGFGGGTGEIISLEAQDVLDRMSGLTPKERSAIIHFVNHESVTLGNGNWALIDEFFCFSLAGANALIGMKAKTATNNGAVLSLEGASGDGVSQYIDSEYNPSTGVNYKQDDALFGVYLLSHGVYSGTWSLVADNSIKNILQNRENVSGVDRVDYRVSTSSSSFIDNKQIAANNLLLISRKNATQQELSENGVGFGANTANSTTISTDNIWLLGRESAGQFFEGIIPTAIFGAAINFDQAAHYTNHKQLLIDLGVPGVS